MELRIGEIQSALSGAWVTPEQRAKEGTSVPPVKKVDGGMTRSVGTEREEDVAESSTAGTSVPVKETAEAVQSYLDDLNITLNFKVEEQTGEMIVSVKNRDTGDVIRQIPPEALVDLRKRLEELRGVLYDNEA